MILSKTSKKSVVTGKKSKNISDTYSANASKVKLSIKLSKIKSITKKMLTKTLSVNQNNIRTITERASSRRKSSSKRSSRKKSNSQTLRQIRLSSNKTKKRKRCPNGTRRNKKTGNCEPYNRK
jgi:hypothetical protein